MMEGMLILQGLFANQDCSIRLQVNDFDAVKISWN